jgi:hypothetical protein
MRQVKVSVVRAELAEVALWWKANPTRLEAAINKVEGGMMGYCRLARAASRVQLFCLRHVPLDFSATL